MTKLSIAIKTRRKLARVKQRDLAEQIGCSQQLIGRWESGAGVPGSRYITALANFLDVDEKEVLRMAFVGDEDPTEVQARLDAQDEKLHRLELKFARLTEILEAYVLDDDDDHEDVSLE